MLYKHLVNRNNSTDVTGSRAVKNCVEANKEWNYKTRESENILHKSKQQPSS
jgi:hypothetical protein